MGGFVVALQDTVKAISWLTDRSGPTRSVCFWWCFHEVTFCFSSPGLRSPRSNTETSKTSEPRIAQWQATVCCRSVLKPHKYFIFFCLSPPRVWLTLFYIKREVLRASKRWWKRFGPRWVPVSASPVCDLSELHSRGSTTSVSVRHEEAQLSKMMCPR